MRRARRAWARAACSSLAVLAVGSWFPAWEVWDVGQGPPESANLWRALLHLWEFCDFENWLPGELDNPNFRATAIIFLLMLATGLLVWWSGLRRVRPEGAQDYGDAVSDGNSRAKT